MICFIHTHKRIYQNSKGWIHNFLEKGNFLESSHWNVVRWLKSLLCWLAACSHHDMWLALEKYEFIISFKFWQQILSLLITRCGLPCFVRVKVLLAKASKNNLNELIESLSNNSGIEYPKNGVRGPKWKFDRVDNFCIWFQVFHGVWTIAFFCLTVIETRTILPNASCLLAGYLPATTVLHILLIPNNYPLEFIITDAVGTFLAIVTMFMLLRMECTGKYLTNHFSSIPTPVI